MSAVIFLFGPSCSGKSTLGKALQQSLGREWTYIDRDVLIEQKECTDETADKILEEKIQSLKSKIIIDAQIPWRERQNGEFYFMILPPLQVLLERDKERTVELKRSEKEAFYTRAYVLGTYNILNRMDKKSFNHYFDSSRESVSDEVRMVKSVFQNKESLCLR